MFFSFFPFFSIFKMYSLFLPTAHIPSSDRFNNANSTPLRSRLPLSLCSDYKAIKLGPFKVILKNRSYFLNLILVSAYLEFHLDHFLEKKGCKRPKHKTESRKPSLNAIKRGQISLRKTLIAKRVWTNITRLQKQLSKQRINMLHLSIV